VAEKFKSSVEWEVLISEDPYSEALINYIVNKYEVQLALIGNKNKIKGTGAVSGKLLRLLKCNILSILKRKTIISKIWAGTDFQMPHKVLMLLKMYKATDATVKAVHVYNVRFNSLHTFQRAP
jgi:hypothetical protein